jgi:pimeloyl-ACP methyl ester carboxylesterase
VVVGEEDAAIAPARSRAMAERIGGARLVTIPRAGHTSTIEEPEAVNEALRAFWASVETHTQE